MIFEYYREHCLRYSNRFFISEEIMLHTALKLFYCEINSNKYILPYDSSSIDFSLSIALKKNYSEHLERNLLGIQLIRNKTLNSYELKSGEIHEIKGSEISYLSNSIYGYSDTTGTSSGYCNTQIIIEKGVFELVEKNELALIWYGMLGSGIRLSTDKYSEYLRYFNDYQSDVVDDIVVLYSQNISNIHVIYVFLFKEKKIVSSGIAGRLSFNEAFNAAIEEAKLLLVIYQDIKYGEYASITKQEYIKVYNHIKKIENIRNTNYSELNKKNCEQKIINIFSSQLDKFEVVFLNPVNTCQGKTVKISSSVLYNCIPRRENIKSIKKIFQIYHIDPFKLEIPDCIIV